MGRWGKKEGFTIWSGSIHSKQHCHTRAGHRFIHATLLLWYAHVGSGCTRDGRFTTDDGRLHYSTTYQTDNWHGPYSSRRTRDATRRTPKLSLLSVVGLEAVDQMRFQFCASFRIVPRDAHARPHASRNRRRWRPRRRPRVPLSKPASASAPPVPHFGRLRRPTLRRSSAAPPPRRHAATAAGTPSTFRVLFLRPPLATLFRCRHR